MSFQTDQALWYNNGVWGELGYAVPNFGNDATTLNGTIHRMVSVIGRNLSAVMHHGDADLRVPPSINTLTRIHKLILRGRTILASRDVESGEYDMEPVHSTPAPLVHEIYPVPYFKVRNPFMKEYCGLILNSLSEAMQHTENRKSYEISTAFSGLVGQYLHRVYRLMATELFGVSDEAAKALDFTLTDEQLASYDPSKYFTSTELIDTVPPLSMVPTEDDLRILTDGIPATMLVGLSRYPSGQGVTAPTSSASGDASNSVTSSEATDGHSFAAPPVP